MLAPTAPSSTLQQQISTKVDVQQLSVIGSEVRSVVNGMIAGPSALQSALDSKLTSSPLCQCLNPNVLNSLNATLIAESRLLNATLSCHGTGLVLSSSTNTCEYASPFPDCGPTLPGINTSQVSISCSGSRNTFPYGSTCSATCTPGHLFQSTTLTCGRNGTWQGNALACVPLPCSAPLTIPVNATISGSLFGFTNDVRRFSCNSGFTVSGSATTTCLASGSWSSLPPVCARKF